MHSPIPGTRQSAAATVAGAGAAYSGCAAIALEGLVVAVLFVREKTRGTAAPARVNKVK